MTRSATNPHRVATLAVAIFALPLLSCTDNATKLANGIEHLIRSSEEPPAGTTRRVPYRPKARPDEPYTLIFLPDHDVTSDDLVEAGLSRFQVQRVFRDLDYIHVGEGSLLVVLQQNARLNFTSYWRRFAVAEEVLVLHGVGTRDLLLERVKRPDGIEWAIRGWADQGSPN